MDRQYWERIAPNYNEEIFDVLQNDKSGKIVSALEAVASKEKTVSDIGCAIGKWIPLLSTAFKHVTATDISSTNLEIAKEKFRQEGKPEAMLDKISQGALAKFFKESTLLNQAFIKENKESVREFLQGVDKGLTVTSFYRYNLAD